MSAITKKLQALERAANKATSYAEISKLHVKANNLSDVAYKYGWENADTVAAVTAIVEPMYDEISAFKRWLTDVAEPAAIERKHQERRAEQRRLDDEMRGKIRTAGDAYDAELRAMRRRNPCAPCRSNAAGARAADDDPVWHVTVDREDTHYDAFHQPHVTKKRVFTNYRVRATTRAEAEAYAHKEWTIIPQLLPTGAQYITTTRKVPTSKRNPRRRNAAGFEPTSNEYWSDKRGGKSQLTVTETRKTVYLPREKNPRRHVLRPPPAGVARSAWEATYMDIPPEQWPDDVREWNKWKAGKLGGTATEYVDTFWVGNGAVTVPLPSGITGPLGYVRARLKRQDTPDRSHVLHSRRRKPRTRGTARENPWHDGNDLERLAKRVSSAAFAGRSYVPRGTGAAVIKLYDDNAVFDLLDRNKEARQIAERVVYWYSQLSQETGDGVPHKKLGKALAKLADLLAYVMARSNPRSRRR